MFRTAGARAVVLAQVHQLEEVLGERGLFLFVLLLLFGPIRRRFPV